LPGDRFEQRDPGSPSRTRSISVPGDTGFA
jgi:hypothetical protein